MIEGFDGLGVSEFRDLLIEGFNGAGVQWFWGLMLRVHGIP